MSYQALEQYYGESLKTRSKDDRIFFINSLKTFDPRTKDKDLQFELYPFQIDYAKKLFKHIDESKDLFVEKSRDMGVSWTTCAVILWYFLFEEGFQCLIGSRKEDYVDNKTIDSLFGKLDYLIKSLPWKIQGYKEDKHRLFMKLSNPENGSNIQGESANANFSRGGRYKCLTGDTLISTTGGLLKIEDMVKSGKKYTINSKSRPITVTRFLTNAPETVYEVKTKYGYSVKGTKDHKLLTDSGYKQIEQITSKDSLILANLANTTFTEDLVTEKVAKLMGWLVSEGSVSSKSHIQFTQKEKYLVDEFAKDFEEVFGRSLFIRKIERDFGIKKAVWWVAERSCMDIREKLDSYGMNRVRADKKEIPSAVLQSSDSVLRAFLQSLYEGDGSVGKYGGKFYNQIRVSYTTKSELLARQVQVSLLRFGIVSGIKKDKRRNIFQVDANGVDAQLFMEKVGFLSDRKNYYNGSQKLFVKKALGKTRELPVVSIEEVGEEVTYDFEVPEEHNFIANGLVSHNCVFFDEMAFWPYQEPSWTAAGDATPCRIAVTTPSAEPSYAKSIRNSGLTELYSLHWHLHPKKTQQWYEEEKKRRTPEEIARELDINWEGALTGIVYPEIKHVILDQFPLLDSPIYCSWDFGLDGVAILWWQRNLKNMKWRLYQSYFNQDKPISFYFPFFGKQIDSKYSYSQKDFDVMETVKELPPATHFGDPDVDKRSLLTGTSTKEALAEANIYVQTNRKSNDFESRKQETKLFLMKAPEINDTPTNRYFIDCIRSAHYPQRRETSQAVTPVRLPVHDNSSHPRTALEFFCVNIADLKDEAEFVTFKRGDSITGYGNVSKGYKSVGAYEDYATFKK